MTRRRIGDDIKLRDVSPTSTPSRSYPEQFNYTEEQNNHTNNSVSNDTDSLHFDIPKDIYLM